VKDPQLPFRDRLLECEIVERCGFAETHRLSRIRSAEVATKPSTGPGC
jgi:hypothetical protein